MVELKTKTFDTQLEGLNPEYPNVHILVVQSTNPDGAPLTQGQMEAALGAAKASLELTGAEVAATWNALHIDALEPGQVGFLKIDVKQTVYQETEEDPEPGLAD